MKRVIYILFLFLPAGIHAQLNPADLSTRLTTGLETDREKVTAIFRWITGEIAYRLPDKSAKRKKHFPDEIVDDTSALLPLTERVARKVLEDRKAVCEGYSRLFKSLCDHAGIPAVIISGFARATPSMRMDRFRSNHTWNAVYFDSSWHLLDATWASGYIQQGPDVFVKSYDNYFFLTPPEKFARHHFPDDLRWTLLDDEPAIFELKYTPYRVRSFNKYDISSFSPSKGIIEVSVGDTLRFQLQRFTTDKVDIISDSLWDDLMLPTGEKYVFLKPVSESGKTLLYEFPVTTRGTMWVNLMFNNDAILRYKLVFKNHATAMRRE